jgi:hypothetical protein
MTTTFTCHKSERRPSCLLLHSTLPPALKTNIILTSANVSIPLRIRKHCNNGGSAYLNNSDAFADFFNHLENGKTSGGGGGALGNKIFIFISKFRSNKF